MTTHNLEGRTCLITGASSGIGAHLAQAMAQAGARVALGARRTDLTEQIASEIREAGGEALAVSMDVTREASVAEAFERAHEALGPVDTVVANAGVSRYGRSTELAEADLRQVYDTNLFGVHLTANAAARTMMAAGSRESGRGRIVIIGSITAQLTGQGDSAYAASKAGVDHLGRQLAREWVRQGINVNVVQPGYIRTELVGDWFDSEGGKARIDSWHRRRIMGIDALDDMVLYLCSSAAGHITGSTITVDDGQSL
ncbi:MAG: short-chain dehydrogenase [Citromicrobium sp.]|nr:short-chain dehydrogenase [Citromicrobium sp.]MAO96805.1 short-chain dehydrogenase [Citromicrobium sp.]MAS84578.1 short-chain dehydrogenase [Erythrobacteraceae bacterium]MBD77109.1 short-chain dehydrogenase [Citromicrobium sp.]MBT47614.1 short-chain dehydrogenase [Citromicrobium sp.]|tara:strand:- start:701 stop:1468 length:768 start_codon:yes stop_codon:yes gene_type:complete